MTHDEKATIHTKVEIAASVRRLGRGIKKLIQRKKCWIPVAACVAFAMIRYFILGDTSASVRTHLLDFLVPAATVLEDAARLIRLITHLGEVLRLIKKQSRKIGQRTVNEFTVKCPGISLDVWKNKQDELESALNISISEIREGKDKQF